MQPLLVKLICIYYSWVTKNKRSVSFHAYSPTRKIFENSANQCSSSELQCMLFYHQGQLCNLQIKLSVIRAFSHAHQTHAVYFIKIVKDTVVYMVNSLRCSLQIKLSMISILSVIRPFSHAHQTHGVYFYQNCERQICTNFICIWTKFQSNTNMLPFKNKKHHPWPNICQIRIAFSSKALSYFLQDNEKTKTNFHSNRSGGYYQYFFSKKITPPKSTSNASRFEG